MLPFKPPKFVLWSNQYQRELDSENVLLFNNTTEEHADLGGQSFELPCVFGGSPDEIPLYLILPVLQPKYWFRES